MYIQPYVYTHLTHTSIRPTYTTPHIHPKYTPLHDRYVARAQFAANKWQEGKTANETAAGAAADAAVKAPRAWLHSEQTLGLIWAEFDEATSGAAVSHCYTQYSFILCVWTVCVGATHM